MHLKTFAKLFRSYWNAKNALHNALPNLAEGSIDEIARLICAEDLSSQGEKVRLEVPTTASTPTPTLAPAAAPTTPTPTPTVRASGSKPRKVNRDSVLRAAKKVIADRELSTAEIHSLITAQGEKVYLPYLGILLTQSPEFTRVIRDTDRQSYYSLTRTPKKPSKKDSKKKDSKKDKKDPRPTAVAAPTPKPNTVGQTPA